MSDTDGVEATKAKQWFDLPYDVRQMIIDKMDSPTAISFLTSSPLFLIDIPRSFIKQIEFRANQFTIRHQRDYNASSFILDCSFFYGACEVTCIVGNRTIWKRAECMSVNEGLVKLFNNLVRNSYDLRDILIYSWDFPFHKTTISKLRKLENIRIQQENRVNLYDCGFFREQECFDVLNVIDLNQVPLSRDQFLSFSCRELKLRFSGLVSEDVNVFLTRMHEGGYPKLREMLIESEETIVFSPFDVLYDLDLMFRDIRTKRWFLMADKTDDQRLIQIQLGTDTILLRVFKKDNYMRARLLHNAPELRTMILNYFRPRRR